MCPAACTSLRSASAFDYFGLLLALANLFFASRIALTAAPLPSHAQRRITHLFGPDNVYPMDPLVSISIVLAVMVFCIYRRLNLGITVFIGLLLTSVLFGRAGMVISDAAHTIADPRTISLMLMIYLVFLLNNFLSDAGVMRDAITSFEEAVSDTRVVIAAVPMLIGLMPSPSGAVLSAPFTDHIGEKAGISKERRFIINYWFRHISEYINPVYPGIILATTMLGISFYRLFAFNMPVMAFYAMAGIVFYLAGIEGNGGGGRKVSWSHVTAIAKGVVPILTAVILPVALKLDLSISLAAAIIVAFAMNPKPLGKDTLKLLKSSFRYDLIMLVFLIMLFKNVLDASDATRLVSSSLIALGVPKLALLTAVPMVMGFLTGLTMGYVGLSFPIIAPFLESGGVVDMSLVTLSFVSGYVGVLLSPLHLCFSVTQKYFKADLRESYRLLLPPVALTFLWTLILTLVR